MPGVGHQNCTTPSNLEVRRPSSALQKQFQYRWCHKAPNCQSVHVERKVVLTPIEITTSLTLCSICTIKGTSNFLHRVQKCHILAHFHYEDTLYHVFIADDQQFGSWLLSNLMTCKLILFLIRERCLLKHPIEEIMCGWAARWNVILS